MLKKTHTHTHTTFTPSETCVRPHYFIGSDSSELLADTLCSVEGDQNMSTYSYILYDDIYEGVYDLRNSVGLGNT